MSTIAVPSHMAKIVEKSVPDILCIPKNESDILWDNAVRIASNQF